MAESGRRIQSRDQMKHTLAAILFVLMTTVSGPVIAQSDDSDRVRELERIVEQLERRVSALEAERADPPENTGAAGDARELGRWRQLQRGMREADVEELLGAPDSVDASPYDVTWNYGFFGYVRFDERSRVEAWREPREP